MEPSEIILYAGLLPGAIVGVGLLCAWLTWRAIEKRRTAGPRPHALGPIWVLPILLGLALIPIDLARDPRVQVWPKETTERFPHIIVAACLFALIDTAVRAPLWLSAILRIPLFGAVSWAILEPLPRTGDASPGGFWLLIAGLGAALAAVSIAIDASARRVPTWITALILLVAIAPIAPVVLSDFPPDAPRPAFSLSPAHFAQGAFQAGALIAALGAVALAHPLCRALRVDRALAVPTIALAAAILCAARWFGGSWAGAGWTPGLPIPALALFLLAPAAAAVPALPGIRRRGPMIRLGLGALFAAICAGLGTWLAHESIPARPPPGDDPYADFYDDP
ncbi:MAG: hypothetical protein H6811_00870 [Phycisphaeraceae bacterium]|nr:hypothetical protein [Phycisphaeraceae bacterium]